jgi:hypothetical protein
MEKLIFEIIAALRSKSQKGDVSQALADQGFFGDAKEMPKALRLRNKQLSGGNSIDVKKDFLEQNPD